MSLRPSPPENRKAPRRRPQPWPADPLYLLDHQNDLGLGFKRGVPLATCFVALPRQLLDHFWIRITRALKRIAHWLRAALERRYTGVLQLHGGHPELFR